MIQKSVKSLMMAGLMLVGGSPALADGEPGMFSVSPMFGAYRFDSDEGVDRNGTGFGLGLGYYLTDQLSVEGTYFGAKTDTVPGGADIDSRTLGLGLNYDFFDLGWAFTPYLGAGLGHRTLDLADTTSDKDYVLQAGGGFKYFFNEDMALRLDGRWYRDLDSNDGEFDHASAMLGFTVLFGRSPAPVPAPMPVAEPEPEPAPAPAPVVLDSDGDGVLDPDDACPGTPPGTTVDERGCAKLVAPMKMGLKVEFDFDKAVLRNTDASRLDEAVAFMKRYKSAVATIEGHTDSRGSDAYNQKLSEARAAAVVAYMVQNGIAADRLKSVGYGEQMPIDDNDTDEGRQRNRRVVAVIIEP